METFPFGIKFVLQQDAPTAKNYSKRNDCADIDCPACKHKGKLHLDFSKNVFRCNACGEAGGVLKLHQIYLQLPDTKTAYADLAKRWNNLTDEDKAKVPVGTAEPEKVIPKATFIDLRDRVYRELLQLLSLSDEHKKDLLKRGLTEEQIKNGGYKSLPVLGFCTLAELSLWKAVNIPDFQQALKFWRAAFDKNGGANIPGYFQADSDIRIVRRKAGYFVPVRDRIGRISGMQIRYDALPENATEKQKEMYHKYSWFSSSEKNTGCTITGIETIHHVGFDTSKTPETIYLTEGALKADIASALSGKPFIALIGVNNSSQLKKELEILKANGTKMVKVAVDMDYRDKPTVRNALDKIMNIISDAGLDSVMLTWPEEYKGIDDFLLENRRRRGNVRIS